MTNHAHMLLKTGLAPVATVMRRLLTGHAVQFNRRHKRRGHLFQNRYKSFLCEEDPYLLELVRDIHLNPFRAKIVKDLNGLKSYRYCGHSVIMGKIEHELNISTTAVSRALKRGRKLPGRFKIQKELLNV
jgi:hypothetical protein